ncbi:unnamed protein product [Rotaria magnacalcarata]|uniref:Histone acetyltransferase n=1 Tax=Rotaria magnacalcarata TaxID=392030 RepID=A0A815MQC1_9BILA|nr:unnamed protein product [Rotaria magnacalcarata]
MNHYENDNHPKVSSSSAAAAASSSSSKNNLFQNIQQPPRATTQSTLSEYSAKKRLIYPNVPKRTQRQCSSINEHDTIETQSEICIIPSETISEKNDIHPSIVSSTNQNDYIRHNLELITKYTSPQKLMTNIEDRSLLPTEHCVNNTSQSQPTCRPKNKRTLSPLYEANKKVQESKRTKSFDEEDADDELSQFLDHRCSKKLLSQAVDTTTSSQSSIDGEPRKPTLRKPTARKLSNNQQNRTVSQTIPSTQPTQKTTMESNELLIIEPDLDTEEDDITDRGGTSKSIESSQVSNKESSNQSILNQIMISPIRYISKNQNDSASRNNIFFTPVKNTNLISSPSSSILKKTLENSTMNFSPNLNLRGRRDSSTSSSSFLFETPCSSFSRAPVENILNSSMIMKNDHETQTLAPSTSDMIHQLILKMNETQNKVDYNAIEISKKIFHRCTSPFSTDKYQTISSLVKKQFLNIGRYEMETLFPMNSNRIFTIYACDICLKHFNGSSLAYQRHVAKCLRVQPPGKLVFSENDLAIFQIGNKNFTMEQRIYIKSLCRISRLFVDSKKNIDDTKIDRFIYYILCRRDPILSLCQSTPYRFIGYFSKQVNQHAQQTINNVSCLFILPPFTQHQEYNQLLIAFSYFLVRSNAPENLIHSSPARPLDILSLSAFRIYWCDIIFDYIINHNQSSIKNITLDALARQTFIHPRDILLSLYSNGSIVSHPTDKSCVYLRNNSRPSTTSLTHLQIIKKLYMNFKSTDTHEENTVTISNNNDDKNRDSGIEEIVID